VTDLAAVDAAYRRLEAFRERYVDVNAVIDAHSGLTVADLDVLLMRLQQTKNISTVPMLHAADVQAFLASRQNKP
jgi:inosine-uridine nucleoside N-ribohydrolase